MPDGTTRRQRKRYFTQEGTRQDIKDAIYGAAPVEVLDEDRIMQVLEERLNDYRGRDNRFEFRAWAVEWVTRYAKLTTLVKPLLPGLREAASAVPGVDEHKGGRFIADNILRALHRYHGPLDLEPFEVWAKAWTIRTAKNTVLFAEWYDTPKYQQAVRDGVMSILRECSDLGALTDKGEFTSVSEDGGLRFGVVETLCRDAWVDIYHKIDELACKSSASTAIRLRGRAAFTAHAWKKSQLDYGEKHDTGFVTAEEYITLEERLPDDSPFTATILLHSDREMKPVELRHCSKCNASLARGNESEPPVCRPCWEADYYGADAEAA